MDDNLIYLVVAAVILYVFRDRFFPKKTDEEQLETPEDQLDKEVERVKEYQASAESEDHDKFLLGSGEFDEDTETQEDSYVSPDAHTVGFKRFFSDSYVEEETYASCLFSTGAYQPETHVFVGADKTLSFAFECFPLTGGGQTAQERMQELLKTELPDKSLWQFNLFKSPHLTRHKNDHSRMRHGQKDPLLKGIVDQRNTFLEERSVEPLSNAAKTGKYGLINDTRLVVSVKIPIEDYKPTAKELKLAAELQNSVHTSLQSIPGLFPRCWDAEEFLLDAQVRINWGEDALWRIRRKLHDLNYPLCDQILDSDRFIEIAENFMRIGEKYVKVMSAKELPELAYFGDAMAEIGDYMGGPDTLQTNYAVVTNIFCPNNDGAIARFNNSKNFVVNQAQGKIVNYVPILKDKLFHFQTFDESLRSGARIMRFSKHLVIYGDSIEHVERLAQRAKVLWREKGYKMMPDKGVMAPLFLSCMPMNQDATAIGPLSRHKTLTSEHIVPLLPVFGEWKGTGQPHLLLNARAGQIQSLSLHDSDTNKNAVICAQSGGGKSFLLNFIISMYRSTGAIIRCIDAGKSYEKLCHAFAGAFLQFDDEADICLNPFPIIANYASEGTEGFSQGASNEIDGLVSLMCIMLTEDKPLDAVQVAALKRITQEEFNLHKADTTFDHIQEACYRSDDQRVKDMGTLFHDWTKGAYAKYFKGTPNVNFDNPFVVLELDDLQSRPRLRKVILFQLISLIQNEIYLTDDKSKVQIVILDEAWDLLADPLIAKFIESAYRKFRKYGGLMIIASQSVSDLYGSASGKAIAYNSATKFLLNQTSEAITHAKRDQLIEMSDFEYKLLYTVRSLKNVYSEIFTYSERGRGVMRLFVGNFERLLFSTDPVDVGAIDKYIAGGMNTVQAIDQVILDRGWAGSGDAPETDLDKLNSLLGEMEQIADQIEIQGHAKSEQALIDLENRLRRFPQFASGIQEQLAKINEEAA